MAYICMDNPLIGSGKILIGKDGKVLVQGDDKVASSNPIDSHKLVTQKHADGTSNLFMVPSEGVNKGKFFLVMPQERKKLNVSTDVLQSFNVYNPPASATVSNTLETMPNHSGSQSMSAVLKNIATRISSESNDPDIKTSESAGNSTTSPSNSLPDMSTGIQVPASVSSYVLTGASITKKQYPECAPQTSQVHDTEANAMPSAVEPTLNVTLGGSGIAGTNLTLEPSVNSIPISPFSSVPCPQPLIIITTGGVPTLPLESCPEQPLLAALNAPPLPPLALAQAPQTPAMTGFLQTPNVAVSSMALQPATLAAKLTPNQTTISTALNFQQLPTADFSNSSQQAPLIPLTINTNEDIISQTTTTSSNIFLQAPITAVPTSAPPAPLFPVMITPKQSEITPVSNFQQALKASIMPTVTESPLFVTKQQAANLLSMSSLPVNKISGTLASFMTKKKKPPAAYSINNVAIMRSQKHAVNPVARKSTGFSTVGNSSNLTTTATTTLPKSVSGVTNAISAADKHVNIPLLLISNETLKRSSDETLTNSASASHAPTMSTKSTTEVTNVAISAADGQITIPVLKTVGDIPVLSNKTLERSSDETLTNSASASHAPTMSTKSTTASAGGTIAMLKTPVTYSNVSDMSYGTCSSSATPMLLFSHDAARNLKPIGLEDPLEKQGDKEVPVADASTTKTSPQVAVSNASLPVHHQGLPSVVKVNPRRFAWAIDDQSTKATPKKITVLRIPVSKANPLLQCASSGSSIISSSPVTSSYTATSCNVSSSVAKPVPTVEVSTTVSNTVNVQNAPHRAILQQTASSTNTSGTLSYSSASNLNLILSSSSASSFKPRFTFMKSTETANPPCVVTSVIGDRSTDYNESGNTNNQRVYNVNEVLKKMYKPTIIVSAAPAPTLKRDNATVGNLVSIVPSNVTKRTTYPSIKSLLAPLPYVVKTTSDDKDVKNVLNPGLKLSQDNKKHAGTIQSHSTSRPTLKMTVSSTSRPTLKMAATDQPQASCNALTKIGTDDLPILIDSVFSLSTGEVGQTTKSESFCGAQYGVSEDTKSVNDTEEDMSNTNKVGRVSLNMELSSNTNHLSLAPNLNPFEEDNLCGDGATFCSSDESKKQALNPQRNPVSSVQSMSQILREFDHLSNFNGVILPDEAITESKIFSPCYVVLETIHMHGRTMQGINTRCSRTCRQNFISKKSNIRLAIQKKKSVAKQVESKLNALVTKKTLPGSSINSKDIGIKRSRDICLGAFDKDIYIKRSRDICRAAFGEVNGDVHNVAVMKDSAVEKKDSQVKKKDSNITTIKIDKAPKVTSSKVSLRVEEDKSERVEQTTSQSVPVVKKVPNTEQFYLIRVDGKTVLIPYMNSGSQPKAFIINEEKVNLDSFTVNKDSSSNDTTLPNEIVLPRVSRNTAAASVNGNAIPIATKPTQLPTVKSTGNMQVNIKPEPITHGYGDQSEANKQPLVIVKQERMDRGYSDEPPKLERMDIEPQKWTSRDLKSKRVNNAPDLTAEEVAVPAKIQKVLSKEERISSLKELLKKQEKDLEEMRKRRVTEATPVDLDF